MPRHVIVIGAGVGGLAAAGLLAKRGHQVTLVEKNADPGGKMGWLERQTPAGRFVWDTGPSLLTLPQILADLFATLARPIERELDLIAVDPISRYLFADGALLDTTSDLSALRSRIEQALGWGAADGFFRLLQRGRHVWHGGGDLFLRDEPARAIRNIIRFIRQPGREGPSAWRMLRAMAPWASLADVIRNDVPEPRMRALLMQYATYSGTAPWNCPALLSCIPYVEFAFGGWYPRGGMHQIAQALARIAGDLGVTQRFNTPVAELCFRRQPGRAHITGVRLATAEVLPADAVVCNADAIYAHAQLIPPEFRPHYTRRHLDDVEPSGSGVVFMWAVDRDYPILQHHTKFIPADYHADLRAMFVDRELGQTPAVYVNATCRTDPSHAPPGCMNLFVLASAPPLPRPGHRRDSRIAWEAPGTLAEYRRRVLASLATRAEWGLGSLAEHIVDEQVITPMTFRSQFNAWQGSIYGIAGGGLRQSRLRPANRYPAAAGLFFAGGATHPGGGVPLVTLSGTIAANAVERYFAER